MELLIVCVIGSIITGGLIMLWFNINRSSAMTASHAEARDFARDGIARLSREIRDAEALPGEQAVQEAEPLSIAFTTTFNVAGNEVDTTAPRLVRYWCDGLLPGRLYRDVYAAGVTDWQTSQRVRHDVVIPYTLNTESSPIFSYTYIDAVSRERLPKSGEDSVHRVDNEANLLGILLVSIYVKVDLDIGKAPNPMEITTQAQLRNQRVVN